jgi:hypothetical protein
MVKGFSLKGLSLVVALAVVVAFAAPRAEAVLLAETDLNAAFLASIGALIAGPITDDFTASDTSDIGDIENTVYFDGSVYTYIHKVTTGENNVTEVNTAFDVLGFTPPGHKVGWSFSDALAAGGAGTAADMVVNEDPDGTIDWEQIQTGASDAFFDSGESIRFFFQSSLPPGLGDYNLINAKTGTATSYAPVPVPEPSSLLLLGAGLVGFVAFARRRQKKHSA